MRLELQTVYLKKFLFILLQCILLSGAVFAQSVNTPNNNNQLLLLKGNGATSTLEEQHGEVKSNPPKQSAGHNKDGSESNLVFANEHSSVKVPTNAVFIIKLADASIDPGSAYFLAKVAVKKSNREIAYKGQNNRKASGNDVKLDFENISPGVYKVIPQQLQPGAEYGFVSVKGDKVGQTSYLFGTK